MNRGQSVSIVLSNGAHFSAYKIPGEDEWRIRGYHPIPNSVTTPSGTFAQTIDAHWSPEPKFVSLEDATKFVEVEVSAGRLPK